MIFIENIPFILSFVIKILFLVFMVYVAFGCKSLKAFLKCCGSFFLSNFAFEGAAGMQKMGEIMEGLRNNPPSEIGGLKVLCVSDFKKSKSVNTETKEETVIDLPKSNVLSYDLEGSNCVIVRPSGTEPKIKIYYTAVAPTKDEAMEIYNKFKVQMEEYMK